MDKTALKRFLIDKAKELGFDEVRISKAEFMEEEAPRLEDWLNNNHHGNMDYLADHFDKRVDPTVLVPGAKSVVSLLFNYYPEKDLETEDNYKVARYAYGKDYHYFVKKKLRKLLAALRAEVGEINGRAFVDSAPVLERDWAKRSGLGWIGKNTLLLNKNRGSYFFLSELIIDVEFDYDHPVTDLCGTCTRCIDACPTEAIAPEGFVVDGSKCISYLTIELKEKIPSSYKDHMEDWILGCDICQEVCPWNRFSTPNNEPRLQPKNELQSMRKKDWEELTEDVFNEMFSGTPFKRLMYHGLKRNIDFISENTKEE